MNYKFRRSRLYSQNFLRAPELVKKLLRNSSIGKNDIVLEIGPGKGIITSQLIKAAEKVIAVELDPELYLELKNKFKDFCTIGLVHENILDYKLPQVPYKVFSNIPFINSADIVRKLTSDNSFEEGYLIVQKEFAQKIIGMPYDVKNQMMSVLLKPWFDIRVIHEFNRHDFFPFPSVDIVMIRIVKLIHLLVKEVHTSLYQNFVTYSYNKKKMSYKGFLEVLNMFNEVIVRNDSREINRINSEAAKINNFENKITKIYRTRNDKDWRKYR